jgi:hypothetical protein
MSYTYNGSGYAPTEGGNGTPGSGDNTTIEEVNLLTFLGFTVPSNATVEQEEAIIAEAVDELHVRLNNGGVSGQPYLGGMKLAFYLDLPRIGNIATRNTSYQNTRIRISGFNHYKNSYNTRNHIVFEFKHIPVTKQMRSDYTNNGGYPNSTGGIVFRSYVEGELLTALKAALGITGEKSDYIYTVRRNVTQGYKGAWTKAAFDAAIFPFCEKEIFGTNTYGDSTTEADLSQMPIYAQGQTKVKKYNGSALYWWEGSPRFDDSGGFCGITPNGTTGYSSVSDGFGCSPGFCLS